MPASLTEPPIKLIFEGQFHSGAEVVLFDEPLRRTYQQAARRVAFRALTSGRLAAQLLHVFRIASAGDAGPHHVMGSWLLADPVGNATAHRGLYIGQGGPWELANAIIPGSANAVQPPVMTGYYRDHPEDYRELLANHEAAMQRLLELHVAAVEAGHFYAAMQTHGDPSFVALLRAAVGDRATQLVLHDWLAEHGFPHVDELRSKRWNQGKWTANQLLDLLTRPFDATRRSFSGRTI